MLGMLSNAKRKLNRIGKDIRILGEIKQKKNHEEWHQGFLGDDNGCLNDVKRCWGPQGTSKFFKK